MILNNDELPEEVKQKIHKIALDMREGIINDLVQMSINKHFESLCVGMS